MGSGIIQDQSGSHRGVLGDHHAAVKNNPWVVEDHSGDRDHGGVAEDDAVIVDNHPKVREGYTNVVENHPRLVGQNSANFFQLKFRGEKFRYFRVNFAIFREYLMSFLQQFSLIVFT